MLEFRMIFMRATREGMQGADSKPRATPQRRLFGMDLNRNICEDSTDRHTTNATRFATLILGLGRPAKAGRLRADGRGLTRHNVVLFVISSLRVAIASLIGGLNGLKHRVLKGGRLLGLGKSVSQQGIIKSSTLLSGVALWGQSDGSKGGGKSSICGFMRVGLQFSNCILFLPLFLISVGGCTAPKEPMGGTVNAHTVNVKNAGLVTITVLERDTTEKQ